MRTGSPWTDRIATVLPEALAWPLSALSTLLGITGAALLLLAPAAATAVESLGKDSPVTLAIQANHAEAVRRSGDPETAVGLLEAIMSRIEQVYGTLSDSAQTPKDNLLAAYLDLGDFDIFV